MISKKQILGAEAIGTFFLTFAGAGAIIVNQQTGGAVGLIGIALAHGLALSVIVCATMNISGGQINPAVTIGLLSVGKVKGKDALPLIIVQLIGATVAGLFLYLLFPREAAEAVGYGAPALADGITLLKGGAIEVIATAILAIAIYGTALSNKKPDGIGGFGIGLTVTFLILAIGPLTGAAMNPARHFGSAVFAGHWAAMPLYWIAPIIGAVIGFQIGKCLFEDSPEE